VSIPRLTEYEASLTVGKVKESAVMITIMAKMKAKKQS
jgi:hypothetical protein